MINTHTLYSSDVERKCTSLLFLETPVEDLKTDGGSRIYKMKGVVGE